ncbi:MAG: tetratricopeptide repeat protein [Candidatus Polarisedimenticolia bacterium]
MDNRPSQRASEMDLLACPAETELERFIAQPLAMDPRRVRAVSRHLGRCMLCREQVDRVRRTAEGATSRRPWIWAIASLAILVLLSSAFLALELRGRGRVPIREEGLRPDARLAVLARFDPPGEALLGGPFGAGESSSGPPGAVPPLSAEDLRQLAAARGILATERPEDGARLLEDLVLRHPRRGAIRLLLAYAWAMAGDHEKAAGHYRIADEQGLGPQACWGLANACLRLGDIACARIELADHLLARRPDDEDARDLLARLTASRARGSR